jgi:ribonuclease P/MRP protein subunit POP5
MVRLKSRYLLIDILYPDPKTWPTTTIAKPSNPTLSIHSPTSDTLTPGFLAKMVRETVSDLYGDWGVGKLGGASAGGLNSMWLPNLSPHLSIKAYDVWRMAYYL